LEEDSSVHELRTFDRYLPACGKVDQSEVIYICTLMQACLSLAYVRFPAQLLRSRLPSPTSRHDLGRTLASSVICMYVDERVVEKSAFYSNYTETLVDWCKVYNHGG
jgi:hypothetical protein